MGLFNANADPGFGSGCSLLLRHKSTHGCLTELAEVLQRGIRIHPAAHRHLNKTHQRKPVFPQFFPYFCPPFYNPIILLCQLFRAFVKSMQSGQ